MHNHLLAQRVEQACQELGLDHDLARLLISRVCQSPSDDCAPHTATDGELGQLQEENQRLKTERERWATTEREIMQLLRTSNPQKIIHDLRNLLNELSLLQALTADNV